MKKIFLLFLLSFLAGCATATQMATTMAVGTGLISGGEKQMIDRTATKVEKAVRPVSESEEYYIGRAVAARILNPYKLYRHPQTVSYVNHVGNTLALNSPKPFTYGGYHFAVLDTEEINAFACPGGIVLVTRGILALAGNEDELAAILAHEIGHVTHRHGIQSISSARWAEVASTLGKEAAREYSGTQWEAVVNLFDGTVDDVFQTLVVKGYSRELEQEADASALSYLRGSGYDPAGLLRILETLEKTKGQKEGGLFSTHPGLEERMKTARMQIGAGPSLPLPQQRLERFKLWATQDRGFLK